LMSSCVDWL